HQGMVSLPTLQNIAPLLLALPGAAIIVVILLRQYASARNQDVVAKIHEATYSVRDPARSVADQKSVELLALAGLGLLAQVALFGLAQGGGAASYHVYKLLFVLTPVAAAIGGAAALRLGVIARPRARWLALAAVTVLLAATGSFRILPVPAAQP